MTVWLAQVNCLSASEVSKSAILRAENARIITSELRAALADNDPSIRALAVRAVCRIGVDGAPADTIGALIRPALIDRDTTVRRAALFSLGLLPRNAALASYLTELMPTLSGALLTTAIVTVGRLAPSGDTTPVATLSTYLSHPDPAVRKFTALGLLFAGDKTHATQIKQLALADPDKGVRDTALYALSRQRDTTARDVYLRYLNDTDPTLVMWAIRGVEAVGDTTLAMRLSALIAHPNHHIRSAALSAMGALRCRITEDLLVQQLKYDYDQRRKAQIIRLLIPRTHGAYASDIFTLVSDTNRPELDAAIVAYLASAQTETVDPILDPLLSALKWKHLPDFFQNLNEKLDADTVKQIILRYLPFAKAPGWDAALTRLGATKPNCAWALEKLRVSGDAYDYQDRLTPVAIVDFFANAKDGGFFRIEDRLFENYWSLRHHEGGLVAGAAYQDRFLSVITGLESFAADTSVAPDLRKKTTERLREYVGVENYIVSREACSAYRRLTGEDVSDSRYRLTIDDSAPFDSALAEAGKVSQITIFTEHGPIVITLDHGAAPLTCLNFIDLTRRKFYDGLVFHRVIPGFVTQGGDPRGDGWGGPGHNIRCEYSALPYIRGAVGIATSGKDTGGSQFFITVTPQPHLEARYTVFGHVADGMLSVDNIGQGERIDSVRVTK